MNAPEYFSKDYLTCRRRFLEASHRAGARLHTLSLDSKAPDQSPLTIDIAWLGSLKPSKVVCHSSGIHGPEGFAGSAIQLKILHEPLTMDKDMALIMVHALNPYGMAFLRRTNESNVDLNRNFLKSNEPYSGTPKAYSALDPLFNPHTPPSSDFFLPRLLLCILRYGFASVKQTIACGQYEFPKGLFFGGKRLEQGPRLYTAWLKEHIASLSPKFVFAIDVHTGLGKWSKESLFVDPTMERSRQARLSSVLHRTFENPPEDPSAPYLTRGSLHTAFPEVLPDSEVYSLVQEFGTYPLLKVIGALREDNRLHYYGKNTKLDHPVKQRLKELFYPSSNEWQRRVLENGVNLVKLALLFRG